MSTPNPDVGIGRGAQVIGVAVASLAVSWICVSLRFYVRLGIQKFFGREGLAHFNINDPLSALVALLLEVINYGLGRHMKDIPPHDMPTALKLIFVCEILYVAATAMTKVAIGVYFLRLASKHYQTIVILTTMVVAVVFSTIYFFFLVFQCQPVAYLWGYYQGQTGHCISKSTLTNVTYAHAAMSAVSDWSFGILPVFFVRNLKLNPRTKASVILILSLGFFASSATLVRIVYIQRLYATTDYSYEGINIVKWSMVEPAIGIAAAAIATLRPLFTKFLGNRKSSGVYTGDNTNAARSDTAPLTEGYSSGKDSLSSEFREMLGLHRGEVTTRIYAGNTAAQPEKQPGWKSWLLKKPSLGKALTWHSHSSTADLGESGGVIDWNTGITKTITVTREE